MVYEICIVEYVIQIKLLKYYQKTMLFWGVSRYMPVDVFSAYEAFDSIGSHKLGCRKLNS